MTKKIVAITLAGLMLCTTLAGCGAKKQDTIVVSMLEENAVEAESVAYFFKNNDMAKNTNVSETFEYKLSPSLSNLLLELSMGKIDFFSTSHCVAAYLAARDSVLTHVDGIAPLHYHMATRSEDEKLCKELSTSIDALKADGSMDSLIKQYITDASGDPAVNTLAKNPNGETHVVGITGDLPPMDYVAADGTPAGFNVALLNAIAAQTGCNFEIVQIEANARLTALSAKKIDIIFWNYCAITGEFEPTNENIVMTDPYLEENLCYVTKEFPVEKIKEIYGIK